MSDYPKWEDGPVSIVTGNALEVLREMPDESVNCVVTSPPYWGLRDYGTAQWEGGDPECDHKQWRPGAGRANGVVDDRGQRNRDGVGSMGGDCKKCGARRIDQQLGLEPTPEEYVEKMVDLFSQVRRVLKNDGTLWLNIGDSYNAAGREGHGTRQGYKQGTNRASAHKSDWNRPSAVNLKPKDLVGIPWLLAFALRADGWYLRQDIIWSKPNPMPESVTDRCTKAHEYIFLLSKSQRYYYDADAIAEPCIAGNNGSSFVSEYDRQTKPRLGSGPRKIKVPGGWDRGAGAHGTIHRNGRTEAEYQDAVVFDKRNKRSVWEVTTQPFSEAHFATFPEDLVKPCILAGCPKGGLVLDPFCGSGTTLLVAEKLGCRGLGIELNPEYVEIAKWRLVNRTFCFPDEEVPA